MAVSPDERASNQIADTVFTESKTLKTYRKTVIEVYECYFHKLSSLLNGSNMKSFAEKALQAKLINFTAMKDANFENIFSQFRAGLQCKSSISAIQRQSQRFLDILEDIGGQLEEAGKDLAVKLSLADLINLMHQYNLINEDLLEMECDDGLFMEVSLHMNRDYNIVGRSLNLSSETLHSISQSPKNNEEKKIAVLRAWKRENDCSATAKELIEAFLRISDRCVAESILKYLSTRESTGLEISEILNNHFPPKSNFPIWKNLTLFEKNEKTDKLMEENRIVRKAYKHFVDQLMWSYKEKNVDPMVIQMHVLCYSRRDLVDFNFDKSDSISTVFCEISKHSCWFDYELFSEVIVCSGTEKKYLKMYEVETLIPYLKRSIFERPSSDEELHLVLKMTADLCEKGKKVKDIQRKLVKLLHLEGHVLLHFENIS